MPTVRRFPELPDVLCRGEALGSPVYWLGLQWAVTADGVEKRDGTYVIERSRVHETHDSSPGTHPAWTWETHVGAKGWADIEDFREAMAFARRKWPKRKPVKEGRAAAPPNSAKRPGKLVACTDTVADRSHAIMAQIRFVRWSTGFVEITRSGSEGLKHLPSDQVFAVDVRELRGLIRILLQAEAKAVEKGLLAPNGDGALA